MATDASAVRFKCRFCDKDFPTRVKAISHAKRVDNVAHKDADDYRESDLYHEYEDASKMSLSEKIRKAAGEFETLTHEALETTADEAGTSKAHVLRVWKDAGYTLSGQGRRPATNWLALTNAQRTVLALVYKDEDLTYREIAERADCGIATVRKTINNYSFLLEDEFTPVGFGDMVDKALNASNESETTAEADGGAEVQPEDNELSHIVRDDGVDTIDELQALEDAGVEYEIDYTIECGEFDAVKQLIEAGYEDVAQQLYEE